MQTVKLQPTTQSAPSTISRAVPLSISDFSERLMTRGESERLHLELSHVTDYTAWFRLTKTVGLLFTVEMTGKLEERGDTLTLVTGELRTSLFTYMLTALLAVLTLITVSSPVALLFGLLCLRLVLMHVFCAPDTREQLVRAVELLD